MTMVGRTGWYGIWVTAATVLFASAARAQEKDMKDSADSLPGSPRPIGLSLSPEAPPTPPALRDRARQPKTRPPALSRARCRRPHRNHAVRRRGPAGASTIRLSHWRQRAMAKPQNEEGRTAAISEHTKKPSQQSLRRGTRWDGHAAGPKCSTRHGRPRSRQLLSVQCRSWPRTLETEPVTPCQCGGSFGISSLSATASEN